MAKFISIWKRNKDCVVTDDLLLKVCKHLEPDNIQANKPKINEGKSWSYGIINPVSSVKVSESGLMLGMVFGNYPHWDKVQSPIPDGTFALVRDSETQSEVISDFAGSRCIWYYFDQDEMVVSSSQRAIITYLGNFHWNEAAIPWMLSTGTLGPYLSWDKRITLLPRNAMLKLDKTTWNLSLTKREFEFIEGQESDPQLIKNVINSIESTFEKMDLKESSWSITLSGGKDSRGLFLLTKKKSQTKLPIPTFTYGLEGQDKLKHTDGDIAKKIANKYNASNQYFSSFSITENENISTICERLLKAGEGRVDHIVAYLDGMQFWKYLFEHHIEGVLRGDVGFGFPLNIRFKNYIESQYYGQSYLCKEWTNLKLLPEHLLNQQILTEPFLKKPTESFDQYHDRFYIEFRVPIILSALSDFKLSYVELVNPLLSRGILEQVQRLPTHLRKGSPIWKPFIQKMEPDIPFANNNSFDLGLNEMEKTEFKHYLLNQIKQSPFLSDDLKELALKEEKNKSGLKNKIKKLLRESSIKNFLTFKQRFLLWRLSGGSKRLPTLAKEKLRNRIFIIAEMQRILHEDSKFILKS